MPGYTQQLRCHDLCPGKNLLELLRTAYCMELETIMNYLANSVNLDGVRAEEIKKSLAADVTEDADDDQPEPRQTDGNQNDAAEHDEHDGRGSHDDHRACGGVFY